MPLLGGERPAGGPVGWHDAFAPDPVLVRVARGVTVPGPVVVVSLVDGEQTAAFPRLVKAKPGETIIFAWIVFKSRAHRDRVNQKVMKDPRIAKMDPASMPVNPKRMSYGGFTTIVSLG